MPTSSWRENAALIISLIFYAIINWTERTQKACIIYV